MNKGPSHQQERLILAIPGMLVIWTDRHDMTYNMSSVVKNDVKSEGRITFCTINDWS